MLDTTGPFDQRKFVAEFVFRQSSFIDSVLAVSGFSDFRRVLLDTTQSASAPR
jgi:hypothetical protein